VVITAIVARRKQLQERVKFFADALGRPRLSTGAEVSHAEAVKQLQETEAAMRELDKRVVPWLHCHPDCSDLFPAKQAATTTAQAA